MTALDFSKSTLFISCLNHVLVLFQIRVFSVKVQLYYIWTSMLQRKSDKVVDWLTETRNDRYPQSLLVNIYDKVTKHNWISK